MTVVVRTSRAMPIRCGVPWPARCRWIWPLTLHSWPGMVTSPVHAVRADGLRGRRLRIAADGEAAAAASDDTTSLMFFTGPLPSRIDLSCARRFIVAAVCIREGGARQTRIRFRARV